MDIQTQLAWVRSSISELQTARSEIDLKLERELERERLLSRLAELEEGTDSHAGQQVPLRSADGRRISAYEHMVDAVETLLSDLGRPSHISEIRQRLIERGIQIPGRGVEANIIVHLGKDPRFERVAGQRGVYALKNGRKPVGVKR